MLYQKTRLKRLQHASRFLMVLSFIYHPLSQTRRYVRQIIDAYSQILDCISLKLPKLNLFVNIKIEERFLRRSNLFNYPGDYEPKRTGLGKTCPERSRMNFLYRLSYHRIPPNPPPAPPLPNRTLPTSRIPDTGAV